MGMMIAAQRSAGHLLWAALVTLVSAWGLTASASAQGGWSARTEPERPQWRQPDPSVGVPRQQAKPRRTPRDSSPVPPGKAKLALEALLTADSAPVDRGLVWRVFRLGTDRTPPKLVTLSRDAEATLVLPPGEYAVNAAFGRAYLTQLVMLEAGRRHLETFVLNAGGLRVRTEVSGAGGTINANSSYDIFSDERDQSGNRRRIASNVRPGLITRLNSGIYHIVSRLGDANAQVSADVAVEAGKLTEAMVSHEAGKATFKLVTEASGEAQADTEWIIMTRGGEIVKETAGALPSHLLAPGDYSVSARWGGKLFTRTFAIRSGDNIEVEVMMR
jgi:hypothetical protein